MQSTFIYTKRARLCGWLNEITKPAYTKWFKAKKNAWDITIEELEDNYQLNSLGNHLHKFLIDEGFNIMKKHESHDIFHLLTSYGTSKEDEIAMQCFLYGNGKRTLYTIFSILIGICILPEFYSLYYNAYKRGQSAFPLYKIDYKPLLHYPLQKLKWIFNIRPLPSTFNIKHHNIIQPILFYKN